jgi:hypothetical protein
MKCERCGKKFTVKEKPFAVYYLLRQPYKDHKMNIDLCCDCYGSLKKWFLNPQICTKCIKNSI